MKIKSCLILAALLLLPTNVLAQQTQPSDLFNQNESPVIQDVEGLRAEFKQYTQDPATKIVKFEMILTSDIDTDRLKVTWTTSGPNVFADTTQATVVATIEKGKTYTIPIELKVLGYGVNELFGKAEAVKPDSTYIATIRKDFASNESGEVLPLTEDYNQQKTLNTIKNIVLVVVIVAVILIGGFFGLKRFIKWLDKDEERDKG